MIRPDFTYSDTLLTINDKAPPKGSARDIEQTYQTEDLGDIDRALNGGLIYFGMADDTDEGDPLNRLETTLAFDGSAPPYLLSIKRGKLYQLGCAAPLPVEGYVAEADLAYPAARKAVPGSVYYKDARDKIIRDVTGPDDDRVAKTMFRPLLWVMAIGWQSSQKEWGKTGTSSITFREHLPL